MRAVVVATGVSEGTSGLQGQLPNCLLPLVDRPFLRHVIEFLANEGFSEFDFILSHFPEQIEQLLGDGARWGSTFRYHLARDPFRPYESLKLISTGLASGELVSNELNDEMVLLVHADRLPQVDLKIPATGTKLFYGNDGATPESEQEWTGWAWVSSGNLSSLGSPGFDEKALELHLLSRAANESGVTKGGQMLSSQSFEALLSAQRAVMAGAFKGLLLSGREIEPHLWLGRNARVHSTARLISPVFIGEDCSVAAGAVIGPNAVISNASLIEESCLATNALVMPRTYVGAGLELDRAVVSGNRLVNLRLGTTLTVTDDFVLSRLSGHELFRKLSRPVSRLLALLLLLACGPLLMLVAAWLIVARRSALVHRKQVLRLPAIEPDKQGETIDLFSFAPDAGLKQGRLRYLLLNFLPGLINIAKGEIQFYGARPRSAAEANRLSGEWRALYLSGVAGLFYAGWGDTGAEAAGVEVEDVCPIDWLQSIPAELR